MSASEAKRLLCGASLVILSGCGLAKPVLATDLGDLEQVVVTAQKTPEPLGRTPVSITVVSGDTLTARNITNPAELPLISPSLTFTSAINSRAQGLNIRGVGTLSYSDGIESSVSTVVDGVVLARQMMSLFALEDVRQIEVLRGPQGTLFGKNASAGVVDIHTLDPTPDFQVSARASHGSLNETKGYASLSGPVAGGSVLARLSVYGVHSDGFIHNLYDGRDYNGQNEIGGRLKLQAAPTSGLTLTLNADYAHQASACCVMTVRSTAPGTYYRTAFSSLIGVTPGPGNETADFDQPYQLNQWSEGLSLTAVQQWPGFSLTSITAGRRFREVDNNDRDLTPKPIFAVNSSNELEDQTSEELRLASSFDGPLSLLGGVFLFNQKLTSNTASFGNFSGALPAAALGNLVSRGDSSFSQAVFGQAVYRLTTQLSLTLGARYTQEHSNAYLYRSLYPGATGPAPANIGGAPLSAPHLNSRDAKLSDRAALDYRFSPRLMAYVAWSRGFKGAGLNLLNFVTAGQIASGAYRIAPETSASFETGLRASRLANRLDLNLTLFNETFHGFQTTAYDPVSASNTLTSAGALRSRGVEVEGVAYPLKGLTFTANLAYTDAAFTNFANSPCYPNELSNPGATCHLVSGVYVQSLNSRQLNNAPRWSFNLGPSFKTKLDDAKSLFVDATLVSVSRYNFSANLDPNTVQKPYAIVDLSTGLAFSKGFQVKLFARNLFDRKYAAAILPDLQSGSASAPAGYAQIIPMAARRLLGVELSGRF